MPRIKFNPTFEGYNRGVPHYSPEPRREVFTGNIEFDVQSDSDRAVCWTVSLSPSGAFSCTCPDYRGRRESEGEKCKHIDRVSRRIFDGFWASVGSESVSPVFLIELYNIAYKEED